MESNEKAHVSYIDELLIPAVPAKYSGILRSSRRKKRSKIVEIGSTEIHHIEYDADMSGWIRPINSHKTEEDGYQHSDYIKSLKGAEAIRKETEKAHIRAVSLQECLMIDDDDGPWLSKAPQGARRKIVRAIQPDLHEAAIGHYESVARKWIVDSGCPLDLIASDELSNEERKFIFKILRNVRLSTANGGTDCKNGVAFDNSHLEDRIEAHLLDSTPNVVSMGKRCMKLGYDFVWRAGQKPFLVAPSRKRIILEVIHDVPYLPMGVDNVCDPNDLDTLDISAVPGPVVIHPATPGDGEDEAEEGIDPNLVRRDLKAEAKSKAHLMTHFPFNKWCPACNRCKKQQASHFDLGGTDRYIMKRFGECITGDTLVAHSEVNRGINGEKDGVVLYDISTDTLSCYPVSNRNYDCTYNSCNGFAGHVKVNRFHSDGAPEFEQVSRDLGWPFTSALPDDPAGNGIAENKVKKVLGGTRAALNTAGMIAKWWPYGCKHYCHAENIAIKDGDSAWNRRGKKGHFKGLSIPFGCLIDYLPTSQARHNQERRRKPKAKAKPGEEGDKEVKPPASEDPDLIAKFDPKMVPGIFLGYDIQDGHRWSGGYLVASLSDFRKKRKKPRIRIVSTVYINEEEGYVFPLKPIYDMEKRTVGIKDDEIVDAILSGNEFDQERIKIIRADAESETDKDKGGTADEADSDEEFEIGQRPQNPGGKSSKQKRIVDKEVSFADEWLRDMRQKCWYYRHVSHRKKLFNPKCQIQGITGAPDPENLDPKCLVHAILPNGKEIEKEYYWAEIDPEDDELGSPWVGFTKFWDVGFAPHITKQSEEDVAYGLGVTREWEQVDETDSFQKPKGTGAPSWESVHRRKTYDLVGNLIANEDREELKKDPFRKISNSTQHETVSNPKANVVAGEDVDKGKSYKTVFQYYTKSNALIRSQNESLAKAEIRKLEFFASRKAKKYAIETLSVMRDDLEKLKSPIPRGPADIRVVTYDDQGEVITTWKYEKAMYYQTVPDNQSELWSRVAKIETFRDFQHLIRRVYIREKDKAFYFNEANYHQYTRTDTDTVTYVSTQNGGPAWRDVVCRDTFRLIDGERISREIIPEFPKGYDWRKMLPEGNKGTKTVLYYKKGGGMPSAAAAANKKEQGQKGPRLLCKVLKDDAIVPKKSTEGAAGLDLCSSENTTVYARKCAQIHTGISVQVPQNTYARIAPRSGLAIRNMLDVGGGVIDRDYRGELIVILHNHSDEDFEVNAGDRVAQLIIERIEELECEVVEHLSDTERGDKGLGSTGTSAITSAPGTVNQSFGGALRMPRRSRGFKNRHREDFVPFYSACVARSIPRKEALSIEAAKAALDKEWAKLRKQGCWDESRVREWAELKKEIQTKGQKVHVGRIFDICVEKNSELADGDPRKKFKGRVVFEGCSVRDEFGNWALFQEMSSCPATMEAAKAADAYGMFEDHDVELADGESAYTQALLGGTPTWVRIPKHQWPQKWIDDKMEDPVCPMILALYGHPDAGGWWEQHCHKALVSGGWQPIKNGSWKSVYWHERLKLILVVYVDDFKMSGPKAHLAEGWKTITEIGRIKMEPPTGIGRYLGCEHHMLDIEVEGEFEPDMHGPERPTKTS